MARWYQDLAWFGLRFFFAPRIRQLYKPTQINYQPEPNPPFFLLANHAHRTDPFIIGTFMKHTVNYMANIEGVDPVRRALSDFVGAFPKVKGVQDISALRHTFQLIKTGNVVGIFPEGDRSWDGETDTFQEGIAALLKKLKVPLRIVRLTGNYLALPRWSSVKRQGQIICELSTLNPDEYTDLDADVLAAKLHEMLYRNDVKDERLKDVEFHCDEPASGVHFLLWLCPRCQGEDTLKGNGDEITCSRCGTTWNLDANLRVEPEIKDVGIDLKDWSDWQRYQIAHICESSSAGPLTKTAGVSMGAITDDGGFDSYGDGELLLFKDRVEFRGDNQKILKVEELYSYVDNFNESFQFAVDHQRYKAFFHGQNAAKWIFFLRYLQGKDPLTCS